MIYFRNLKFKVRNFNKGMTFIELVVVLAIFTIISSISLFQYKDFQESVDLKSFANDISLKISEAQVNSINGKLIDGIADPANWKPTYGVKFDTSANTRFAYYVNVNNFDDYCSTSACTPPYNPPYHDGGANASEKVIDAYTLNKGFFISDIRAIGQEVGIYCPPAPGGQITNVEFRFIRPNVSPIFYVAPPFTCSTLQYVDITLSSSQGKTTKIRMHKTGQIQLVN